jgi:hypothetical protein
MVVGLRPGFQRDSKGLFVFTTCWRQFGARASEAPCALVVLVATF